MSEAPDFFFIFVFIVTRGLPTTLLLTAIGILGGFFIGLSLAIMRVYGPKELQWFASGYEKVLRGIPLMALIFIFVFGIPLGTPLQRPLNGVILALAVRSGAYQSQIFRGAILSVNPEQMQAARALGMTRFQALRHIIFPQALRLAIPSWSNEYAIVIKDSSFAYAVGVIEMTRAAYYVFVSYPELYAPSWAIIAILYFLLTYPLTRIFGERQTKKLKKLGIGGG